MMAALTSFSRIQAASPPPKNEYVDSRICADCHTEIAESYSKTGMARSFYAPDAASVPDAKPYFHQASGTWYQVIARDGAWFEQWWQIGPKGEKS